MIKRLREMQKKKKIDRKRKKKRIKKKWEKKILYTRGLMPLDFLIWGCIIPFSILTNNTDSFRVINGQS
jgi:hypothetical protein